MAMGAASLVSPVRADDDGQSIWDILQHNALMKGANRDQNTAMALATIDTTDPILSSDTDYNIQVAIQYYQQVVARGGWEPPSRSLLGLSLGKGSSSAVAGLKQMLRLVQDYPTAEKINGDFDNDTDLALRKFQVRHGIIPTGKVDAATFQALSVTADQRLAQLQLNSQRVENAMSTLGDRYVVVNIPAAAIEAINNGVVEQRHTAVVGRVDRPTPILDSKIMQIIFNPFWHVPKSIIQKDLIPLMQKDPTYLANFHIRTYNSKGVEVDPSTVDWTSSTDALNYAFTQDPGAFNSEGHVKINFPSPDDVYLHDTPEKELFAEDQRFDSSGCVRVKDVDQLVTWLLQDNGGWTLDAVQQAMDSNNSLSVPVKKPMPLHTTYITAWANKQYTVSFREDVYQLDAQGVTNVKAA